ncbi:MAG TPA: fatty acyl-AMP ligase [Syntrophobacteria bacterium]|nr:fatty acyl-AMP ligase [Syntrophobacteria bacterium]
MKELAGNMVDRKTEAIGAMEVTPSENRLPLRLGDFATLTEALEYAAQGDTGFNFYTGTGKLYAVLPYARLKEEAQTLARRLLSLGLGRGARVALVAETTPDFHRFFFACQYAGLVPVPLPAAIHLGGHQAYVSQLRRLLTICEAQVAMAPVGFLPFLSEAAEGLNLRFFGSPESFAQLPESDARLQPLEPHEIAYLQYTSGSTRFPRGVMITEKAVMSNLADITRHGVKIRLGDRCVSWLPYYHDMGLVGTVLAPVASQLSVDYLGTRDFAMRPRQWLNLMDKQRATISFSPPFGYELCVRRLRKGEPEQFDLSAWRVAGVGAETIRPGALQEFAEVLAPSGFDSRAFLACYGMAECSLAVSFAPLDQGLALDCVDSDHLAECREALPVGCVSGNGSGRASTLVNCGIPLPGYGVEIRDEFGRVLAERRCGTLFVKGPSVMSGYFNDPEVTGETLSSDGWLNTGDLGYRVGDSLVITGRAKDLIIINGRNIWPQDLEYLAEQQPEVRTGDASAFSVPGADGEEKAVLVVQCREADVTRRSSLVDRLHCLIREELGIDCFVELVPPHTLPRTSSGKLSRSGARRDFLKRMGSERLVQPQTVCLRTAAGDRAV